MTSVIIVGAGPVGLTAAIECARRGDSVTIFDRASGPTDESRAVGINRQSLLLLQNSGVAEKLLSAGFTLERAKIHDKGKHLATLKLPQPRDASPPPMILLAQSETEKILVDTLKTFGVAPRWNREARSVQQDGSMATAVFADGERISADYLLGADGSHSFTRNSLGLSFKGETYDEVWSLLDAALDWPFPDIQAAPFFDEDGSVMFVVQIGEGRYRAISNRPDVKADLAKYFPIKRVLWQNEFKVSLRMVDAYGDGRIWIAGDAAHVHSPVGGMGMNLGIEDACDFAATLAGDHDFSGYNQRRLAAAERVLTLTDRGYKFASATSRSRRFVRNSAIRAISNLGVLRSLAARRLFRADMPDFGQND